ncbi:MAG: ATP-binding cassette domain-containing protein [Anaerolineae bacterium]|jgi:ABC-2 type transport system ATP-binding protein|nr:ATP-binding cassette domain-containing protein [Anaerolineae bacterium]
MVNAIHVDHVSKTYGSFRAVDDLSFEVNQGEIFAMLGPNGAGKSTTIRMILDILKPDVGTISVFGGPLTDAKKDRIGYLPEERGLYRNVKVLEMMTYLGTLKGMTQRNAQSRSKELLERLALIEHRDKKVSELSKGMQQKVQFAVTVLHDPDLIIVDEPFSGLDPVNTLVIKDLMLDMKQRGKAVVMSSHEMHQVEEMADRLLMINRGRQALYGPVDEVRRRYAIHAVIVEGQGAWEQLSGVQRVEPHKNGRNAAILHLAPNVTSNDLLATIAAAPNATIERFELAVPSLNDIFIQVAGRDE